MKSISRFLAPLTAVAAGVALCSNAMAQQGSSVTIYGLLDTGVEYVNNVGANKKGLSRLPTASNCPFASGLSWLGRPRQWPERHLHPRDGY